MKQYLDLLQNILDNGVEKESGRENMPNTIGISHGVIRMDMKDGFPLLTTKKMYFKGIIHELLWILRGETNIKYLVDNGVQIWSNDAYRWYLKHFKEQYGESEFGPVSQEEFVKVIKEYDYPFEPNQKTGYILGDLGKVYGYQWRNQNGVDQVRDVIEGLRDNPYSRYHIIDAWNKADFKDMALPPCHLLYQFIVRPISDEKRAELYGYDPDESTLDDIDDNDVPKFYLDLNMYQRSCDTFLGVPFNIASMSLLLHIFAKTSNMIPGVATWIGGDTHLYVDHIPQVKEQLTRTPKKLPTLTIKKDLKTLYDILSLTIDDFILENYKSYDAIKAELFTGLKKQNQPIDDKAIYGPGDDDYGRKKPFWKEGHVGPLPDDYEFLMKTVMDKCVMCGKETKYPKNMHVEYRMYYVEGAGQLCEDCYTKIYTKNV
jgi:thymidylate synthase